MTNNLAAQVNAALSPDSGRHPWERLKTRSRFVETQNAFEAFTVYRDMGASRSLVKVGKKIGKTLHILERWSSQYRWVSRCAEYDDHMDRQYLTQLEEERKEMARRHINLAKLMQKKAYDRLNTVTEGEITPKMIPNYLRTAIDIERMAVGEPTERVDHEGTGKIVIVDDIPRKIDEQKI